MQAVILVAGRHIKGDFLTLYGDSYLDFDYQAAIYFFEQHNKLALMTVYKNYNRYDSSNTSVKGSLVTRYSKIDKTPDMIYIEHGANIFKKQVLDWIPQNQSYWLSDLFPRLIEKRELLSYEVNERFYEIGSPSGLEEFRRLKGGSYDRITCTG